MAKQDKGLDANQSQNKEEPKKTDRFEFVRDYFHYSKGHVFHSKDKKFTDSLLSEGIIKEA